MVFLKRKKVTQQKEADTCCQFIFKVLLGIQGIVIRLLAQKECLMKAFPCSEIELSQDRLSSMLT